MRSYGFPWPIGGARWWWFAGLAVKGAPHFSIFLAGHGPTIMHQRTRRYTRFFVADAPAIVIITPDAHNTPLFELTSPPRYEALCFSLFIPS